MWWPCVSLMPFTPSMSITTTLRAGDVAREHRRDGSSRAARRSAGFTQRPLRSSIEMSRSSSAACASRSASCWSSITVLPMKTRSPGLRIALSQRWPSRIVPFVLPRSTTRPLAVAAVLDARVAPRHVVVVQRQLAGRVAAHLDGAVEDDARPHVGPQDHDERRARPTCAARPGAPRAGCSSRRRTASCEEGRRASSRCSSGRRRPSLESTTRAGAAGRVESEAVCPC